MSWSLSTPKPVPPADLGAALESATVSPDDPQGATADAIAQAKEALIALADSPGVAEEAVVSASAYGHVTPADDQVPEHLRSKSTITVTVSGTNMPPAEPEPAEAAEPPEQPPQDEPEPEAA